MSWLEVTVRSLLLGWHVELQRKRRELCRWRLTEAQLRAFGFVEWKRFGVQFTLPATTWSESNCDGLRKGALTLEFKQEGAQLVAELSTTDAARSEMMLWVCVDLIEATARQTLSAAEVRSRTAAWAGLFANDRATAATGLAGELLVLRSLWRQSGFDPAVWQWWQGPQSARHDIATPELVYEVKTTVARAGWSIHVNGLTQSLRAVGEAPLVFVLVRLEPTPSGGFTIRDLLADVPDSYLPDGADFRIRLQHTGTYDSLRWNLLESCIHRVTELSPMLTRADFTAGGQQKLGLISAVTYEVDMAGSDLEPYSLDWTWADTKAK